MVHLTVTQKQERIDFLNDLAKVREEHAQDVNRSFDNIIPQNAQEGNPLNQNNTDDTQYSIDTVDSEGHQLTPAQRAFFADSKVVDEQGLLLVVYHGTNNDFYVFDKSKIKIENLGRGFYFVDSKEIAESYAERRTQERGGHERVVSSYINAIKPFNVDNVMREQAIVFLSYDYLLTNKEASNASAKAFAEDIANDDEIIIDGKPNYGLLIGTYLAQV